MNKMSSDQEKIRRNYKLLIDPALKKGLKKVYRFNGIIPRFEKIYPSLSVRDPRSPLSSLWAKSEPADLPLPRFKWEELVPIRPRDPRSRVSTVCNSSEPADLILPRFKIDQYYVGVPPPTQVTIKNLNDNINKKFLEDMLLKYGDIEESSIFYHPDTRKHLGLAKVTFTTTRGAKRAVINLNLTTVMGDVIIVYLDPFGTDCIKTYYEMVYGRTRTTSTGVEPLIMCDPKHRLQTYENSTKMNCEEDCNALTKEKRELSHTFNADITASFDYRMESLLSSRVSDRSITVKSDLSFYSPHSTAYQMSYNSGYDYNIKNPVCENKPLPPPPPPPPVLNYQIRNISNKLLASTWGESSFSWEGNSSPVWDNRSTRRDVATPTTPITMPKQSAIMERLDSRLGLLLKQDKGKNIF